MGQDGSLQIVVCKVFKFVIGGKVRVRWKTLIRKVSLGKHAIDHAVSTTIMVTARHTNIYIPLKHGTNAECVPR